MYAPQLLNLFKKSWLTHLSDVVCRIPTSAVHRFNWDSSGCESCWHCDLCKLRLMNAFWECFSFFRAKECPKIMWTAFFWDQILCPSNGDVLLNKGIPRGRFHCISFVPFTLQVWGACICLRDVFPLEYQKVFSVKAFIYSCQVVFCRRHLTNIQAYSSLSTSPCYVDRAYK